MCTYSSIQCTAKKFIQCTYKELKKENSHHMYYTIVECTMHMYEYVGLTDKRNFTK